MRYSTLPSSFLRTIVIPVCLSVSALFCLNSAAAEELTREEVISARLDCFSRAAELPSLDWDAICDTSDPQPVDQEETGEEGTERSSAPIYIEEPADEEPTRDKWFVESEDLLQTPAGSLTGNDRLRKLDISFVVSAYKEDRERIEGAAVPGGYNLFGPVYGFRGVYELRRFENEPISHVRELFSEKSSVNMFSVEASVVAGQIYQTLSTTSSNTRSTYVPVISAEARVLTGYDLPMGGGKMFTGFTGLGYRFDRIDYAARVRGASTYDYDFALQYIPIGGQFGVPLRGPWRVDIRAEYDFLFFGVFRGEREDQGNYKNQKFELNDGYGLRSSVRFTRLNPGPPDFYIEPFVQYWHFQKSTRERLYLDDVFQGLVYIPDFNTIEYGFKVGFVY